MRVIFVSGPPRAGKTTVQGALVSRLPDAAGFNFAAELRERTALALRLDPGRVAEFEEHKDRPQTALNGQTWRRVLQRFSEDFAKQVYGEQVFGHWALRRILDFPRKLRFAVFGDSGFASEAQPVVDFFGIENCLRVHIQRPGCDYSNDTRSDWSIFGMPRADIGNTGSTEDLFRTLEQHILPRCLP